MIEYSCYSVREPLYHVPLNFCLWVSCKLLFFLKSFFGFIPLTIHCRLRFSHNSSPKSTLQFWYPTLAKLRRQQQTAWDSSTAHTTSSYIMKISSATRMYWKNSVFFSFYFYFFYLPLAYLFFSSPQVLSHIQEFLRIPVRKLESRQVKIHTRSPSEQILNWEDVYKSLNGTQYEHFLHQTDYVN